MNETAGQAGGVPRVILIGGTAGAGKTAAARWLAGQLGCACISTDDLATAARAVTDPRTHPGLHTMAAYDWREYYIRRSPEQLAADAEAQHAALWPAIAAVIQAHESWAPPAIIEGWGLLPDRVAELPAGPRAAIWLVAGKEVYEARLRADREFWSGASDPDLMFERFLGRTLRFDGLIRESARARGLTILEVQPQWSPEDVATRCRECLPGVQSA